MCVQIDTRCGIHLDTLRCREERYPCTPLCDNSGNSPQVAAPRRPCEIDESTQRFHVGNDNRAIFVLMPNHADIVGDQSDAVTQNAWFLCAAISGEMSILI